jgi:transcriptional regulator with XRE-family HTH domain
MAEVARRAQISRSYLYLLLRSGSVGRTSYSTLLAIASSLGCDVNGLIYDEEDAEFAIKLSKEGLCEWSFRKKAVSLRLELYQEEQLLKTWELSLIPTVCRDCYRLVEQRGSAIGFCQFQGEKLSTSTNFIAIFDDQEDNSRDVIVCSGKVENGRINGATALKAFHQPCTVFATMIFK